MTMIRLMVTTAWGFFRALRVMPGYSSTLTDGRSEAGWSFCGASLPNETSPGGGRPVGANAPAVTTLPVARARTVIQPLPSFVRPGRQPGPGALACDF